MYAVPDEAAIWFGDLFAGDHLIDVYLRSDAAGMGGYNLPSKLVGAIGKALNKQLDASEGLRIFSPEFPQPQDQRYVLSEGTTMKDERPQRAILLTDSCTVDTVTGVRAGRRARGRLLFAPVIQAADRVSELRDRPIFGRFPLDAVETFEGGFADLSRCFMVDVRDVDPAARFAALSEQGAEELEVAWNAHAVRRGPLVAKRNAAKLAELLAADGVAERHNEDTGLVAELLGVAWRIEGGVLGAVDEALKRGDRPDEVCRRLMAELEALANVASEARDRLNQYQS